MSLWQEDRGPSKTRCQGPGPRSQRRSRWRAAKTRRGVAGRLCPGGPAPLCKPGPAPSAREETLGRRRPGFFPRPVGPRVAGHARSRPLQGPRPQAPTHQRTSCQRFSPGVRRPAMPSPAGRPLPAPRGPHRGDCGGCRRPVPRARSPARGAARGRGDAGRSPRRAPGVSPVRRPAPPRRPLGLGHRAPSAQPERTQPVPSLPSSRPPARRTVQKSRCLWSTGRGVRLVPKFYLL